MRDDVGRLLNHLAVAPDAIARQVGSDVEIDPKRRDVWIADIGHADHRTGLWIELAKPVKRSREFFRQDRKVALHKAVRDSSRGGSHASAAGQPRLQARQHLRFGVTALLFLCQTDIHRTRSVPRQVAQAGSTMRSRVMHPWLSGRKNDK